MAHELDPVADLIKTMELPAGDWAIAGFDSPSTFIIQNLRFGILATGHINGALELELNWANESSAVAVTGIRPHTYQVIGFDNSEIVVTRCESVAYGYWVWPFIVDRKSREWYGCKFDELKDLKMTSTKQIRVTVVEKIARIQAQPSKIECENFNTFFDGERKFLFRGPVGDDSEFPANFEYYRDLSINNDKVVNARNYHLHGEYLTPVDSSSGKKIEANGLWKWQSEGKGHARWSSATKLELAGESLLAIIKDEPRIYLFRLR